MTCNGWSCEDQEVWPFLFINFCNIMSLIGRVSLLFGHSGISYNNIENCRGLKMKSVIRQQIEQFFASFQ